MDLLIITLATIAVKALGGLLGVRLKDHLHLILGFSAGTIFGVSIFDLLPEALDLTHNYYLTDTVTILIAAGFSLYMLLDRLFSLHVHDKCDNPKHGGNLGAFALTVHSFLDGFGIGMAFKVSPTVGWIVAIAVLSHGFWDGINTVNMVLKTDGKRIAAIRWLVAASLAPAAGVALTFFLTISAPALGLILAIFVGLFLYIGASDLIPESHHKHPTFYTSFMTIVGMAVIFFAGQLAG